MTARNWRAALPIALAAIPLLYLIWICARLHVDVPFWDQWELVPRLDRLDSGTLTFHDLWEQHNEHRPLFPVALMLTLARLSHWDTAWEIAANVFLGAAIFGIWWRYLATAWRERGAPLWLLPLLSVLVFSFEQWENWTWGWQITAIMGTCATLLGLYFVSTVERGRWRFAASLFCGVWSTYSFAAGLVYWITGGLGLSITPSTRPWRRLVVWTIAGSLTIASYVYDYTRPAQPSLFQTAGLGAVRVLLAYVCKYLGGPVVGFSEHGAAAAGAIVLCAFVVLAVRLRKLRGETAFLFPCLVGAQTIAVACVSAAVRAWIGSAQAMASRYGTVAVPIWCAVAILTTLLLREEVRGRLWLRTAALAAAIAIAASSAASASNALVSATARSESLRLGRRGLIVGQSDALMLRLYPDAALIRQRRAILRMLRMSVFRRSAT